jgi:hypothetical protein
MRVWPVLAAWPVLVAAVTAGCGRPADALGDIRYFPGATLVGSSSSEGEAFGFPRAAWEQIELRAQASYAEVKAFYAAAGPKNWTSAFESELSKSTGQVYSRYLADAERRTFYVITVEERRPSKDVAIILRRGLAR